MPPLLAGQHFLIQLGQVPAPCDLSAEILHNRGEAGLSRQVDPLIRVGSHVIELIRVHGTVNKFVATPAESVSAGE